MAEYKADMHIHSSYSWDSDMQISTIIKEMEQKKLKYFALTDHIEFGHDPVKKVVDNIKRRNHEIDKLQENTNIKIIKGVEISEPHRYKKETETLLAKVKDIDVVLGSIHHLYDLPLHMIPDTRGNLDYYLLEIAKMIQESPIDVVAHLDYLKRVFKMYRSEPFLTESILVAMIEKDIALEINTSGTRRHVCDNTFPNRTIIEEYIKLGGSKVTFGSDAHRENELYDNIESTSENLKELKLTPGVIINHEFKNI